MKFYRFDYKQGRHQKLPKEKSFCLVIVKNLDKGYSNPIVIGYLKYAAGDKNCPRFITPGVTINSPNALEHVIAWSDCLPSKFELPIKLMNE